MFGWKDKFFSEKKKASASIEELAPGKSLIYRLPEIYHGGIGAFAVIELNQDFPKNGRKYIISTDTAENGNPKGQKIRRWDTNKSKQIIDWLKDKNATPFN
ncbi:MAG: hypothetical protein QG663_1747 [Thermodesulfobacteriota bacterium]|nr:hypothetical protein [Thermodesulfobacteriota bacterium]MDQ1286314.1 hypothetical protein [Thermodesulfobacteriota bacterium]